MICRFVTLTVAVVGLACMHSPANGEAQASPTPAASDTPTPTPVVSVMPEPSPAPVPRVTSWRDPGDLVCIGPTDVPLAEGGEASLLAFQAEREPVSAARYDACVADGSCARRVVAQPAGGGPAVGMRWEHANGFCEATGMRAQSPEQDFAMRKSEFARLPTQLRDVADPGVVVSGFRCVRLECPP